MEEKYLDRRFNMKKIWLVLAGITFLFLFAGLWTTITQAACKGDCCVCEQYIDADGDGICDLCDGCIPVPQGDDADGDGIPNGQDDDYVPPKDGTGQQKGR
jgi:hypothetical protein